MPQLIPFYWLNLLTFGIIAISLLLYIIATYILPNILRLILARSIIIRI